MIVLPVDIVEDLIAHAVEHAPIEACGLLAGVGSVVQELYRLTNTDASAEHFSLDPKEQFAAVKDMRASGTEMLAVYHSHPATPARMSDEDLRMALTPGIRYVIVSLADPAQPVIKSFTIEEGAPVEAPVLIQE